MAALDASSMFAKGAKKLGNGGINFSTDTIKCMLLRKSFRATTFTDTFRDSAEFMSTIAANDRASTSYKTITSDITIVAADNDINYGDGTATVTFGTVSDGRVCGGVLLFKSSGTEASSAVICFNKFSADKTADGGEFQVNVATGGFFQQSYG